MRILLVRTACISAAFLFLASTVTSTVASAQAIALARRGAEIAPFAATTLVDPDWGTPSNIGYLVGIDYTRFMPMAIQPSLEARMTNSSGASVSERSYSGGVKLAMAFHKLRPYGTFMIGYGFISFANPVMSTKGPYTQDQSHLYSLGGGAEYDVTKQWQVKVDFAQQYWNLKPPPIGPTATSIGFSYRIPFRPGKIQVR